MALLFNDATPDYLVSASTPVTAVPLTMACWFYTDTQALDQSLIQIANPGVTDQYLELYASGTGGGDPVRLFRNAGSGTLVGTSTGFSLNTWHHAVAVLIAINSVRVFIDGGSVGVSSQSRTPTGLSQISIGMNRDSTSNHPMSGRIA